MKNLRILLRFNIVFITTLLIIGFYTIFVTKIIKYKSSFDIEEKNLVGKVTDFSINGDKVTFDILSKEKVIVNYYLSTLEEKEKILNEIFIGSTYHFEGIFKEVNNNTIPNNFNYKKYLYNKKIYVTFSASSFKIIKKSNNIIYNIKDYLLKRAYILKNSDFYLVFILGDKSLLNSSDLNNYQINGVSHLLAISGMHISVILIFLNTLLKNINNNLKNIIISLVLILFAFLTSFSASVLRAVGFFIVNQVNKIFNLNLSNIKVLFITAIIILIINPFMIYDLGFIYSFVVCFGIIYYQKFIKGNYIMTMLKLSLVSFIFSFPISAITNFEINLLSIFLNLIFVPLISIVVYPLGLISYIFPIFSNAFTFCLNITNSLSSNFTKISIMINIPKLSIIIIILFYIILLIGKFKPKYLWILILLVLLVKVLPKFDSNFYVYILDVGQGDSIVLVMPHKKEALMIDTGGKTVFKKNKWQEYSKSYNLSDNTIKFLKSIGITKINFIITHGDYDHMGEAINFVNNFKVENVFFNNDKFNELESKLAKVLSKKKIKYYKGLNELNVDSNKIYFLNTKEYKNENDNSNVLYFKLNKYKFLFMGDAGVEREKDILEKYNLTNIDFIKIGHHGSNTSSSKNFIESIKPKKCLISVGKNNRYGHPKKSVLDILNDYCNIYRTDNNGSIEIKINKDNYKIKTYNP